MQIYKLRYMKRENIVIPGKRVGPSLSRLIIGRGVEIGNGTARSG